MQIVQDWPPNIDAIRAAFTLHPGIVFTYGNRLFNPDGGPISPPLLLHEETHCKQQGDDPAGWWDRYIAEPGWRVTQEIAAYRVQFKAAKKAIRDREQRHAYLCRLAQSLSSPMYGSAISFDRAYKAIRKERFF